MIENEDFDDNSKNLSKKKHQTIKISNGLHEKVNRSNLREVPNLWPGNCFGCSPHNDYGLKMRIYMSEKGCFSRLTVTDEYCGFDGIVHGGIIATILDEIAAWTLIIRLQKLGVTQEATIHYFKLVVTNIPVIAEGHIIAQGDKMVLVKASIKSIEDELLAESESKWLIPDLNMLAKLTGKDLKLIKKMFEQFIDPIKRAREYNPPNKIKNY
ncbi:MAG: Thioesterase (modular protein) [Promethearchaeota archaeon]|nr:MAG: Thioesterase (modular protein) [Candidatus Lokiarchaeota archaeon]